MFSLSRWVRANLHASRVRSGRKAGYLVRNSFRPRLEQLEDRTLPALFVPAPSSPFGSGGSFPHSLAEGDYNGDSKSDLAVVNTGSNTVAVFLGDGNGSFTAAPGGAFASGGSDPLFVASGKFNADTVADLVVVNQSGSVAVFLSNGDGTFAAAPDSPFSSGGTAVSVAVGNFNADTLPDLVVVNIGTNNLAVFLGNGDGTFAAAPDSPFSSGGLQPRKVVVGNFNADTMADLAVQNFDSNNVAVFLGNGAGSFTAAPGSPFGSGGNTPNSMAEGDFNADTLPDLAVTNSGSSNVAVFLGDGDGTFTPVAPFSAGGSNTVSVAAGDFNGDTLDDLAVTNFSSNTVVVFLSNGDGTFTVATGSPFNSGGTNARQVIVGNFNADSAPDLAVVNEGGTVAVFLNTTGTNTALAISGGPTVFGQPVTFTATVTATGPGSPTVSGYVSFFEGDTLLQTVAVTNGSAIFTTSALRAGNRSISAAFTDPSASLYRSTSAVVLQQVNAADTTTTLATSGSPTVFGQVVTFTATVTVNGPSAATATGIVSFFEGASLLGTGNLSGGLAAFSTSALSAGSHDITVVFNANSNFKTSTSGIVVQQVNAAPPAPARANGDVFSLPEDSPVTALDVLANDSGSGLTVSILTPAFSGTVALTGGGSGLTYQPNPGFTGVDSFIYQITDSASNTSTAAVIIAVTPVNDAPVLAAPAAVAYLPNHNLSLGGITVNDIDAGTGQLEATVTASAGLLTLGTVAGLTFSTGDGTADSTMSFTGTLSSLSNALASLSYKQAVDAYATDTVTITVNDQGNSGAGGDLEDTVEIAITPTFNSAQLVADPFAAGTIALVVNGTNGNDAITINLGANATTYIVTINGGAAQTITGVTGRILAFGHDGDDTITMGATVIKQTVVSGGVGNDTLNGGGGVDNLNGNAGNDTLRGNAGNDVLSGGADVDNLNGGVGTDRVLESANVSFVLTNALLTGNGNDTLNLIETATLIGGAGDNTIDASAFTGASILDGGAGNDTLTGGAGVNTLLGGAGDDTLRGGLGNDNLQGGADNDTLVEIGNVSFTLTNTSLVGVGTDVLSSLENALLTGGAGANVFTLNGWSGTATINGDTGAADRVAVTQDTDFTLSPGLIARTTAGNVTFINTELVTLTGGAGNNRFTVSGWLAVATLAGGAGVDTVISTNDANFTLTNSALTRAGGGSFTLSLIEQAQLTGGNGNNIINAGAFTLGNVLLDGGGGNDTLTGGSRDDLLLGGAGNDTLNGGSGRDFLLGGADLDTLLGGAGEDILAQGTTTYDVFDPLFPTVLDAAFASILAEWRRTDQTYAQRVAHLKTGGGLNGANLLDTTTLLDDGLADTLTGGLNLDWFFAQNPDTITDLAAGETVN
jgi:hypothetical protein